MKTSAAILIRIALTVQNYMWVIDIFTILNLSIFRFVLISPHSFITLLIEVCCVSHKTRTAYFGQKELCLSLSFSCSLHGLLSCLRFVLRKGLCCQKARVPALPWPTPSTIPPLPSQKGPI